MSGWPPQNRRSRNMKRNTRVALSAMALLIGSTLLGACQHRDELSPSLRALPAVRDVIPDKVSIPRATGKSDAVAYAKRVRNAAEEANDRLDTAAGNYGEVRRRYGGTDE